MRRTNLFRIVFLLITFGLLATVASPSHAHGAAVFANSLADGGHVIIKRSPVLGYNVSISIYVDGQVAGTSVRARTFEGYIAPGKHVFLASPNRLGGSAHWVLNVQRGQTYTFVLSYSVNRLVVSHITKR